MKLVTLSIAVLGLVAFSSADLKSEINTMNTKICAAMVKADFKAFEALVKNGVTSDFKYMEAGRTQTYSQMMEHMKGSFGQMKLSSAKASIVSLKQKGDGAVSVEKHVMLGSMTGPDKKSHKITMTGNSTNTYKKVKGKWLMSVMSWGVMDMTMDGKKVDPSKMGG